MDINYNALIAFLLAFLCSGLVISGVFSVEGVILVVAGTVMLAWMIMIIFNKV